MEVHANQGSISLHTCHVCCIAMLRLGLQAPLVARDNTFPAFWSAVFSRAWYKIQYNSWSFVNCNTGHTPLPLVDWSEGSYFSPCCASEIPLYLLSSAQPSKANFVRIRKRVQTYNKYYSDKWGLLLGFLSIHCSLN